MEDALELLDRCTTAAGFVAADTERANYRRIWARDGCGCVLAALVSGDAARCAVARATLVTLQNQQGPCGQLPSNVGLDGATVSYGGTAGRVDATLWYVLACCLYGRLTGDDGFVADSWPALERACDVVRAWEHNDGGLVYVPQAGDWADEYVLSGYLLYDQALRWWGLRELDAAADRLGRRCLHQRGHLGRLIAERFEPRPGGPPFFCAGFHAGARFEPFDGFGNALCCLLDIGTEKSRRAALSHAAALTRHGLVAAFDPVIEPGDPRYPALQQAAGHGFRNRPGRYHNGGLWPVVTGFWSLAARRLGEPALADRWLDGVRRVNRLGPEGFPEYLDATTGEPGGVRGLAWSAAAELLATADGLRLLR